MVNVTIYSIHGSVWVMNVPKVPRSLRPLVEASLASRRWWISSRRDAVALSLGEGHEGQLGLPGPRGQKRRFIWYGYINRVSTLMSIDIITYLQNIYNYISIYEYEAINWWCMYEFYKYLFVYVTYIYYLDILSIDRFLISCRYIVDIL
jgi:hypothetical protein